MEAPGRESERRLPFGDIWYATWSVKVCAGQRGAERMGRSDNKGRGEFGRIAPAAAVMGRRWRPT